MATGGHAHSAPPSHDREHVLPGHGHERHWPPEPLHFTITPRQLTELVELAGTPYEEAERCRDAGCGPAALMLLGGTAEATLLATVCVFEPELRQAGLWAGRDDPSK